VWRMAEAFHAAVKRLFEILRDEPVVHADETG
jgi:hypothetical protein